MSCRTGFMPYPWIAVPGAQTGPLAGLRLAVKDIFDVSGYPTAAGSAYLLAKTGIQSTTSSVVQQLLDSGAEFVGKTIMDELAYSLIGKNHHFGTPENQRRRDLIPGGSSSGSAVAVAAGLADIGLGTDTSGSVRLPAAANGIYGLRLTHGSVELAGSRQLAPSFDAVGFFTQSLAVMSRVLGAVGVGPSKHSIHEVVLSEQDMEGWSSDRIDRHLNLMGEMDVPVRRVNAVSSIPDAEISEAFTTILFREAYLSNREVFEEAREAIDAGIAERLEKGSALSHAQYKEAKRLQAQFQSDFTAVVSDSKALVFPTLPVEVPSLDASNHDLDEFRNKVISRFCYAGLSGYPQLTIPIGADQNYWSLSIVSGRHRERAMLAFAARMNRSDARH